MKYKVYVHYFPLTNGIYVGKTTMHSGRENVKTWRGVRKRGWCRHWMASNRQGPEIFIFDTFESERQALLWENIVMNTFKEEGFSMINILFNRMPNRDVI